MTDPDMIPFLLSFCTTCLLQFNRFDIVSFVDCMVSAGSEKINHIGKIQSAWIVLLLQQENKENGMRLLFFIYIFQFIDFHQHYPKKRERFPFCGGNFRDFIGFWSQSSYNNYIFILRLRWGRIPQWYWFCGCTEFMF